MVSGDQLQQQFKDERLDNRGSAASYEEGAANNYAQLQDQPGYSAEDAAAIKGDPNSAFKYYNPGAVNDIAAQEAGDLRSATDTQESSNNDVAGEYTGNLNSDLNKSDLTVSPEEMQNIRDVASQTTAGQYTKMQDQAKIRAAAQGNTSPAAMAAIEQQLGRQGAIEAGNAASTAELGANQAKLSAEQTYSGMKTAADTNVANLKSANTNTLAQNRLNAAATAGTAKTGAAEYGQNAGQALAQSADQNSSARAATVANQGLAGQQKVRDYQTAEQSLKQSASSDAGNKQLSAYANEYSGANNATSIGSNNAIAGASNTTAMIGNIAGAAGGALAAFADGAVITKPTVGVIGERGPEKVVKLGSPQTRRYRPPMAA